MADKEWRPSEGWVGQPDYCGDCRRNLEDGICSVCTTAFEAGASAILKAVVKEIEKCPYQQFSVEGLAVDDDTLATHRVYFVGSDLLEQLQESE